MHGDPHRLLGEELLHDGFRRLSVVPYPHIVVLPAGREDRLLIRHRQTVYFLVVEPVREQRLNRLNVPVQLVSVHHPKLLARLILSYYGYDAVIFTYRYLADVILLVHTLHLKSQCVHMIQTLHIQLKVA